MTEDDLVLSIATVPALSPGRRGLAFSVELHREIGPAEHRVNSSLLHFGPTGQILDAIYNYTIPSSYVQGLGGHSQGRTHEDYILNVTAVDYMNRGAASVQTQLQTFMVYYKTPPVQIVHTNAKWVVVDSLGRRNLQIVARRYENFTINTNYSSWLHSCQVQNGVTLYEWWAVEVNQTNTTNETRLNINGSNNGSSFTVPSFTFEVGSMYKIYLLTSY